MPPPPKVRCRQIDETDLDAVAQLLAQGFPGRPRKYWTNGLDRLRAHAGPDGCPEFGYLLEADGAVVGAILLIFSAVGEGPERKIRCNVSSWYVDPAFRGYAAPLVSAALKLKHVTYVNISAAVQTWPILQAQGYRRYSDGQFAAIPALNFGAGGGKVRSFSGEGADRRLAEYEMMRAHLDAGCVGLVCDTPAGPTPFLFMRRRLGYAPFGVLQLVYCRDTESFVRCAGPIGRFLLRRGAPCVICDAAAPIPGLAGWFFKDKTPRFYRGPDRPSLNDLTFTELVLFGP
ncbi:MAG: GNAT family N-acetyltransferase [Caulobacterales bacterium]